MSEAPKPKRTRAKATAAASRADSNASTPAEPQAAGDGAKGSPAASNAVPKSEAQSWRGAAQAGANGSPAASDADSHAARPQRDTGDASTAATPAGTNDTGNVPKPTIPSDPDEAAHARTRVVSRLTAEKRWNREVSELRDCMFIEAKRGGMTKEQAQIWTYGELDRLYPPPVDGKSAIVALLNDQKSVSEVTVSTSDKSGVKGLGDIPPGWPPLPANAALSVEIAWVQANRLYVVEELASGGTRVHLDRAHEAAPSRSAIGWLETSIRSYAKFVEVAAKASGPGDEDGEQIKREKLAIEEILGLLAEMAGNSTGPGR